MRNTLTEFIPCPPIKEDAALHVSQEQPWLSGTLRPADSAPAPEEHRPEGHW